MGGCQHIIHQLFYTIQILYIISVHVSTYHDRKYQSWDGAKQAVPGAPDKATDGKDNGQDQEIIADRMDRCSINHWCWLLLDNNYIRGLKYVYKIK